MARRRLVLRYTGRVQGVGFRYTTCRCAAGHDVTGYVKNLDDGGVEVLAEGEPEELRLLEEAIGGRMGRAIRSCDERWGEATGEFSSFDVAF